MSKPDERFIHGRGKHLFSVDFGATGMSWGRTLWVRADNSRQAMVYANGYDITRLFSGESFGRFCQDNGGPPEIRRVKDKAGKTVWEDTYI